MHGLAVSLRSPVGHVNRHSFWALAAVRFMRQGTATRSLPPEPHCRCLGWRPRGSDGKCGPYKWLTYKETQGRNSCGFVWGGFCVAVQGLPG